MKKIIKSLALLLAIAVFLSTPVYATDSIPAIPRASMVLSQYSSYLHVPSGNEIQVWFDVIGTRTLDEIGVSYIEIQQSPDGQNWTTVKTYSYVDYSNMVITNSRDHCSYVTYYGTYGYYYRAIVTFYGLLGSVPDAKPINTDAIRLR